MTVLFVTWSIMDKRLKVAVVLLLALTLAAGTASTAPQGTASIAKRDAEALTTTEQVLKTVSRLRGLEVKSPVKSGLKTRDQIEQAVIRDLEENITPREFEATRKTLVKLGLIPDTFQLREYVIKLLREQVAGFYEPKSREFYLAAWLPVSEQKTVIAHELVHALQDQHFNLRRFENWPKGESDAEQAAHALVEGEATLVMFQYGAEQEGGKLDVTRLGSLTTMLLQQSAADDSARYPVLAGAPAVLREALQFPYVYGVGFAQEVLKNSSWVGLNNAYANLPTSTEQIIHPERFITRDIPLRIEIPDLAGALGKGWTRADNDVNGEIGLRILLGEFIPKRNAEEAAAGWGGDRYHLYENASAASLLISQFTNWDTAVDAEDFFTAYCSRTVKRYKEAQPVSSQPRSRVYDTGEGLALIELRGTDVVIIEGATDRQQLNRLSSLMWQSRKKR